MKSKKHILFVGIVLVVVFILSFLTSYLFLGINGGRSINPKNLIAKLPRSYIVQSGSMEPVIKTGGIVVSYPTENYSIGDVVTFQQTPGSKSLVTHRIMNRLYPNGVSESPVYQTSGDANEDFDAGLIKHEQIVGKVGLTVPYIGYIADFAKHPYGFILLVIVPATIIIYEELKTLFGDLGKSIKALFIKLRKKKQSTNLTLQGLPLKVNETSKTILIKSSILIPIFGAFLVFTGMAASYFSDNEKSDGNIFGAAASFGEKTASLYNSDPFTCPTGATSISGPMFGNTTIKIIGANLEVDTILTGATPSSTYDIWINQDPGGCPLASPSFATAITTDISGNGSANNLSIPLVLGASNFWVSAVGGDQVLRSVAVQLP